MSNHVANQDGEKVTWSDQQHVISAKHGKTRQPFSLCLYFIGWLENTLSLIGQGKSHVFYELITKLHVGKCKTRIQQSLRKRSTAGVITKLCCQIN